MALYCNETDETDNRLPVFMVVDAVTDMFCEVPNKPGLVVAAAFWSRDGRHLVYETANTLYPGSGTKPDGLSALQSRAFYAVTLDRNTRLALGKPDRLGNPQVDRMLGIAFLPVLRFWEHDPYGQLFSLARGHEICTTPDGRKAFPLGEGVHKRALDRAPADKQITYFAIGRHLTRRLADSYDKNSYPIWSSDGRWITWFDDPRWVWLDPSSRETVDVELPVTLRSPIQILRAAKDGT